MARECGCPSYVKRCGHINKGDTLVLLDAEAVLAFHRARGCKDAEFLAFMPRYAVVLGEPDDGCCGPSINPHRWLIDTGSLEKANAAFDAAEEELLRVNYG